VSGDGSDEDRPWLGCCFGWLSEEEVRNVEEDIELICKYVGCRLRFVV